MDNLKSEISAKFSEAIMLLPDYDLKSIIFYEWSNYFNKENGLKFVNNVLSNKGLSTITEEKFDYELRFIKHVIGRLLMDNTFNFENSFKIMKERGWNEFYVFIDIHSTILYPDYGGLAKVYYPYAKEVLHKLSNDKRIKLGLYTCSHPHEIEDYKIFFNNDNIKFEMVNKNPEVHNTRGGYFQDKPYMNVLLDDKSGFVGEFDWYIIDWVLNKHIDFTVN
jgi:hypothetical protein